MINTDAEGRLVMADALAVSAEDGADAIVDIATLTRACLRTLGTEVAGVMRNADDIIAQVRAAGELADEPVWQLPMVRRYRSQLGSGVADMTNLGGLMQGPSPPHLSWRNSSHRRRRSLAGFLATFAWTRPQHRAALRVTSSHPGS